MRDINVFSLLVFFILSSSSMASDTLTKTHSSAQLDQQKRMTDCNHQASIKSLKSDDRKEFMKSCLKGRKSDENNMNPQQKKMKNCNDEAGRKNLKGDERKDFMSKCLRKQL